MPIWHYITQVHFDFGAIATLGEACGQLGVQRPLLVTDAGVRAAGLADRAQACFDGAWAMFDRTPSNPTEEAVEEAVAAYRAHGADGLVAVGGGSSIDLAKGVALRLAHPEGSLAQYATIFGGSGRIGPVVPLIAVPTTAGTGSEVARGTILIARGEGKLGFHSWHLVPRIAICDPELSFGLGPRLSAATGMDAIAHCIETYLSRAINPPADAIALDGLRRGVAHVERVVADPADRPARWEMMCASLEGAMAFQKGLGAVHALSHAAGGLPSRPHHGTLNAVFLPAVVQFNEAAVPERVATVAGVFGAADGEGLARAIRALISRLGLPTGLAEMGIGPDTYPGLAELALRDHTHATNPRPATRADYLALLQASA